MGKMEKQLSREYRERMIEARRAASNRRARERRSANKAMGAGVVTIRSLDASTDLQTEGR